MKKTALSEFARQVIRLGTLVIFLAALVATGLTAQSSQGPVINPACHENCPLNDLACLGREQACQVKLDLYYAYMAQLGAGVTLHRLPAMYVDVLQRHFSSNLNDIRFGFSDRQPAIATTDCSTMYFGSLAPPDFVNKLKAGQLSTNREFSLLLHELRHTSQCNTIGGRDKYAKMWFSHFDVSVLSQRTLDPIQLHAGMPLEIDAFEAAARFLELIKVNRDLAGKLVAPFKVEVLRENNPIGQTMTVWVGTPQHFSSKVSGGSEPIKLHWTIKEPGRSYPRLVTGTGVGETELDWTPAREGSYFITARVSQSGSNLTPAEKTIQVKANPNPISIPSISVDRVTQPNPQPSVPIFRTLTVEVRRTLADVASAANVCVADSLNQQVYGRKRIEGSTASFTLQPGQVVNITVSANRYVGVSKTLTMADSNQKITITLNRGSGGPVCSVQ